MVMVMVVMVVVVMVMVVVMVTTMTFFQKTFRVQGQYPSQMGSHVAGVIGNLVPWGNAPLGLASSSDNDPIQWDLWVRAASEQVDDVLFVVEQ